MTLVQNTPTDHRVRSNPSASELHHRLFETEMVETPVDLWTPTHTVEEIAEVIYTHPSFCDDQYLPGVLVPRARLRIDLLTEALDWVDRSVEHNTGEWEQSSWCSTHMNLRGRCGTSHCLAGYVGMRLDERYTCAETVLVNNTVHVHVSVFAQVNLGLNPHQAHRLFDGNNTRRDLHTIVGGLADLDRARR
jgi:hypothetical protein